MTNEEILAEIRALREANIETQKRLSVIEQYINNGIMQNENMIRPNEGNFQRYNEYDQNYQRNIDRYTCRDEFDFIEKRYQSSRKNIRELQFRCDNLLGNVIGDVNHRRVHNFKHSSRRNHHYDYENDYHNDYRPNYHRNSLDRDRRREVPRRKINHDENYDSNRYRKRISNKYRCDYQDHYRNDPYYDDMDESTISETLPTMSTTSTLDICIEETEISSSSM
ncbi:hypothetical protein TRFO_41041 [Tritrichomonas foetus]|uniref:Uncharacterized protein n=1 Tax=Tritrichomonas foetus TaxID=1144522 RepID=A0A1J4L1U2_9EUKA|nr:hypothetical protein TRFO_41041 [Tritrichomonas foetus]|eukprot:OHT17386.1 hypothetical protein TRFO_41041 [Tritrichomonas foetus]